MGVLSSSFCVLGLFVLIAYASASPDVFDSVLGNTASCQKSCEMTYTLHTYPRVSSIRDGEVTLMLANPQLFRSRLIRLKSFFVSQPFFHLFNLVFVTDCLWQITSMSVSASFVTDAACRYCSTCLDCLGGWTLRLSARLPSVLHLSVCSRPRRSESD